MKKLLLVLALLIVSVPCLASVVDKTTVSIGSSFNTTTLASGGYSDSYSYPEFNFGIEFPTAKTSSFGIGFDYLSGSYSGISQSNMRLSAVYRFEIE